MNNFIFRPIILAEPIQLDLNEKENVMSTDQTTVKQKPTVSIGDLEIEIDFNKPSERYIITKKYQGSKLFYKKHRRACTSYLSKGTHFDTLKDAQDHFDSFIKTNWKHTKQFQIEPVSNFFISDWRLTVPDTGYYNSFDLSGKKKVILKNVPISIDDYKRGKKLTTVQELLNQFVSQTEKNKQYNEKAIIDYEMQLKTIQMNIEQTKANILDRSKKLEQLLKSDTVIESLIEQNTTEAERTVKLFYGKE